MFCNVAKIKLIGGKLGNSDLSLPSLGMFDTAVWGKESIRSPHINCEK